MEDQKITRLQKLALSLLSETEEVHGIGLVTKSNGAILRSTVYYLLSRMVDEGWATSRRTMETGRPLRLYKKTSAGSAVQGNDLKPSRGADKCIRSFKEYDDF